MRRLETALATLLVASNLGTASVADTTDTTILGTWKTPKHNGKVVIEVER